MSLKNRRKKNQVSLDWVPEELVSVQKSKAPEPPDQSLDNGVDIKAFPSSVRDSILGAAFVFGIGGIILGLIIGYLLWRRS